MNRFIVKRNSAYDLTYNLEEHETLDDAKELAIAEMIENASNQADIFFDGSVYTFDASGDLIAYADNE